MDMSLVDLISNVGFPIAVVCYMFFQQNKQSERHAEETKGFIEAINNNTLALTKLEERLGAEDEH